MGESKKRKLAQAMENTTRVTEAFLQTSGLYERWTKSAPLTYSSQNAPRTEDVLDILFLAVLSGVRRYNDIGLCAYRSLAGIFRYEQNRQRRLAFACPWCDGRSACRGLALQPIRSRPEIGRASCRERVCT